MFSLKGWQHFLVIRLKVWCSSLSFSVTLSAVVQYFNQLFNTPNVINLMIYRRKKNTKIKIVSKVSPTWCIALHCNMNALWYLYKNTAQTIKEQITSFCLRCFPVSVNVIFFFVMLNVLGILWSYKGELLKYWCQNSLCEWVWCKYKSWLKLWCDWKIVCETSNLICGKCNWCIHV